MYRWRRLIGLYVGGIAATVLAYTLAYNVGMATIENDPQSFLRSLEVVLEHFATVGYATEYPSSDVMTGLVVLVRITGQTVVPFGLLVVAGLGIRELSSAAARG